MRVSVTRKLALIGALVLATAGQAPAAPRRPTMWPSTAPKGKASATSRPMTAAQRGRAAGKLYRRAVGVLATALCYHAYQGIKGAADGLLRKAYRRYEVRQRMAAAQRTLRTARQQLDAVGALPLTKVDRFALAEIVDVLKLLRQSAADLERYAETRRKDDFARFEQRRRRTWRRLRKLLGR